MYYYAVRCFYVLTFNRVTPQKNKNRNFLHCFFYQKKSVSIQKKAVLPDDLDNDTDGLRDNPVTDPNNLDTTTTRTTSTEIAPNPSVWKVKLLKFPYFQVQLCDNQKQLRTHAYNSVLKFKKGQKNPRFIVWIKSNQCQTVQLSSACHY